MTANRNRLLQENKEMLEALRDLMHVTVRHMKGEAPAATNPDLAVLARAVAVSMRAKSD